MQRKPRQQATKRFGWRLSQDSVRIRLKTKTYRQSKIRFGSVQNILTQSQNSVRIRLEILTDLPKRALGILFETLVRMSLSETLTACHAPRQGESNGHRYRAGQKQTDNTDNTHTPEATNPRPISDRPRQPRPPRSTYKEVRAPATGQTPQQAKTGQKHPRHAEDKKRQKNLKKKKNSAIL
jgi:hypothetical protein